MQSAWISWRENTEMRGRRRISSCHIIGNAMVSKDVMNKQLCTFGIDPLQPISQKKIGQCHQHSSLRLRKATAGGVSGWCRCHKRLFFVSNIIDDHSSLRREAPMSHKRLFWPTSLRLREATASGVSSFNGAKRRWYRCHKKAFFQYQQSS